MSVLFLVIGLGNPGEKYQSPRHNLGFLVIDEIVKQLQIKTRREKFQSLIYQKQKNKRKVILVKPQTYMNNSGQAVKSIADFYRLQPENIFVIQDEIDLPIGDYRISRGRSSAGHRGIQSIIDALGTKNFIRYRIGIYPSGKTFPVRPTERRKFVEKFVLGKIKKAELKLIQPVIQEIAQKIIGKTLSPNQPG